MARQLTWMAGPLCSSRSCAASERHQLFIATTDGLVRKTFPKILRSSSLNGGAALDQQAAAKFPNL